MKAATYLLFMLTTSLLMSAAFAESLSCKVVGITDGDTVTCLTVEKSIYKVRLAEIDAPESHQEYGKRAKQALSNLIFFKSIRINIQDIDKYGRHVGVIWHDSQNVNLAMVIQGMAWCYRKYLTDISCLGSEETARAGNVGLWNSPNTPIPPWEFRKSKRQVNVFTATSNSVTASSASTDPAAFQCGQKRKCAQMTSCAEAQHYLRQCGLARLDGDQDGAACDSRCQ